MARVMNELVMSLGRKIRFYRLKQDTTLKDLATQIGVTPSLLSQIEHGKASPSLGTLKAIADVFNVPIGILFEMNSRPSPSPLIKKNTFKKIMTEGNVMHSLLSPGFDDLEFFINEFPPEATTGEIPYSHDGIECGYLLKGTLFIELDGIEYKMEEGDSVVFESYRPHKVTNRSNTSATAIWVGSIPWVFKSE
jgi:transcriptional regulator with XRE-family HTH domain